MKRAANMLAVAASVKDDGAGKNIISNTIQAGPKAAAKITCSTAVQSDGGVLVSKSSALREGRCPA
jgi:hypothetical protein